MGIRIKSKPYFSAFALKLPMLFFIYFGFISGSSAQIFKEWSHRFVLNDTLRYSQNQTVISPNGKVYVCGSIYDQNNSYVQTYLMQYDSIGTLNWQKIIDSTYHQSYLAVDAKNNLYINGINRNANYGIFLMKYDDNGKLLWRRDYDKPGGIDWVHALKIDDSNNVYSGSVMAWYYPTLLKYDPNGNLLWKVEDSVSGFQNTSVSLALDYQQNVIFLYTDYFKTYINKFTPSGSRLWNEIYSATGNTGWAYGFNVRCDKQNMIYLIASTDNRDGEGDYALVKYNQDGQLAWQRFFSGSPYYDYPQAMTLDNEANIYVTGNIHPFNCYNDSFATLKYDSAGNLKWVNYYASPDCFDDIPVAIEFSKDGFIYIAGKGGDTLKGNRVILLKYDKAGRLVALTKFGMNSDSWDYPGSMAIDKAGYVYVSGISNEAHFQNAFITKWSVISNTGMKDEAGSATILRIYPNPAHSYFTLDASMKLNAAQFLLYDVRGKLLLEESGITGTSFEFKCSDIAPGLYLYVVREGGSNLRKGKLIIE